MTVFLDFLRDRLEKSGFTTEDALASVLPLFRQVADAHDAGLVAPLDGVERLIVNGVAIGFDDAQRAKPSARDGNIEAMNRPATAAFDVMSTASRAFDVDSSSGRFKSLDIADPDEPLTEPRYVPGYRSWEQLLGHHDPLADQMVLGMVLASVACGFDFTLRAELEEFVRNRRNLFAIVPHLNAVLAQVIVRMTELDRHRRARDLREIIRLLETYRDQPIDFDIDLSRADALRKTEGTQRRTVLLERLQERLFEISRRNRLLYFKPSQKYLNLTIASVPALFDVRSIQPEQLMTWNRPVEQAFITGKPLALGHYLRFEDAPYLPGVLDSIIAETRRDEAELGFSQLRVVLCFLRWHNLKEAPKERIDSPLLLLNVKLTKKKGVRDSYTLQPVGREAEVNPVLRYHLRTLYGINLPESVELVAGALDAFHAFLSAEVRRTEPGVTIEKIDRPHVEIIHDRARRRLDQYKRRQRPTRQRITQSLHDLSYSYRGQVDPLGLKMFQKLVLPSPAPMRELVDENPTLRNFMVAPEEGIFTERERTLVSFSESTSNNPYAWDFDLCNLTLGNFKYRKMTLVRDYETLLSDSRPSRPFDSIFSLAPRPEMPPAGEVAMEEQHTIVECDPTQASAIAHARRNESYIIQGPPGTGKSQTITNLIADYVARGKRVLFVCEKRAALDVVYHRLRQKKLESLCCLIHDSQDDKKEFIADLRTTYEGLLQSMEIDGRGTEQRRRELIDAMRIDLGALSSFDARMRDEQPVAMPLRALLARGVELQRFTPSLSPVESERIPGYGSWIEHGRTMKRVDALLHNLSTGAIFGSHPLRRLTPAIASRPRPHEFVTGAVERIGGVLDDLANVLAPVALGGEGWDTLANVLAVARYARRIEPLVQRGTYGVLDPRHSLAHALDAVRAERGDLQERLEATTAANQHWREKLTAEDAAIAFDVARSLEGSILRFFKSEFWQLRRTLGERYDFHAHAVKPRWTQILQRLHEEHELQAAIARLEKKAAAQFHFDSPLAAFLAEIESIRRTIAGGSPSIAALHAHCLEHSAAATTVARLVDALRQLESIEQELGDFLVGAEGRTVRDLAGEVREVSRSMHLLNETLPVLGELAQLPEPLASAVRGFPLSVTELEAASARRTIHDAFARDASLAKFSLQVRERHLDRLWSSYRELQRENARNIVAAIAGRFRGNVAKSSAPSTQLSRADVQFKKRYSTGRRELEHEFGKSMRYRSIRDLFSGPAGDVMLDLKPVWLMSPLSVSDTLPLDTSHFDVVI
ncbi:MAG TPA: DUF4011 domain-containing protein, partial [Thermoanaerobaculia bacterium]|nr:DUF4011 domain-containing protein [Thermoanaerobaculia bacterium]